MVLGALLAIEFLTVFASVAGTLLCLGLFALWLKRGEPVRRVRKLLCPIQGLL